MKVIAIFLCVITTASCYSTYLNLLIEEWETYKLKFNKVYESKMEEALRMNIYAKSKLKVAEHNQRYYEGEESHLIETNRFSDMLPHEWGQYKGLIMSTPESNSEGATFIGPHDDVILPAFVDWRKEGAVTPVKNQGMCGSCWAFSATGCLEGQHFRKTKQLVSLSEQNLVDCVVDSDGIKDTCKRGGMMNDAYMYIKKNSGIDTEASYPYKATDGVCHFSNKTIGATDKGFVSIPEFDEEALKKAVATVGPISVAIDASMGSFRFYKEGVYYDKHCSQMHLDHGVLAVGYGTTEKGEDYWLVKNSWDDDWGMKGYIMMSRNKDNNCGIATMASYPLV